MTSAIGGDLDNNFEHYPAEISAAEQQIPADRMQDFIKTTKLYEGRAVIQRPQRTVDYDQNRSEYVIDTCLRVKIPSKFFRDQKVEIWEAKHSETKKWAILEGVVSLVGVTAAGGAFYCTLPLWVGVAFGVAAIAPAVLCARNMNRTSEASRQIEGWKADPIEKIATERAQAYRLGFPYVYDHKLKLQGRSSGQVLLLQEVLFLFVRHFKSYCEKLLSQHPTIEQKKKEWLDSFTSYNPVSRALLQYAYDGSFPVKFSQVSSDYEALHDQLKDIRVEFEKLRKQRIKESNKIIKEINENRELLLASSRLGLDYWKNEAKKIRDEKLAKVNQDAGAGDMSDDAAKINDEYDASVRKYELYYIAATIPINSLFDSQVTKAKDELKKILNEIDKNEASSHAPYFGYAFGLLQHALQVMMQPEFVYQPQVFNPAQAFNIPAPIAPPVVNINYFYQQAPQRMPEQIAPSDQAEYLKFLQPLYPDLSK